MKDAKEILASFLSTSKLTEAGQINEFFNAWKSAAGENLAAHSRIKELEKGLVIVETDHPGWIQLLKIEEKNILRRLQKRFPSLNIRGLRFRLGDYRDTSPSGKRAAGQSEPSGKIHRIIPDEKTVEANDKADKTPEKSSEKKVENNRDKNGEAEKSGTDRDDKKAFFNTLERLGKLIENDDRD